MTSLFGPRIDAIIGLGKDGRQHVAYRSKDGQLLAESPPRGYETADEAERAAEALRRGRIEIVRDDD